MRVKTPFKCDFCGKQKGDANHWWLYVVHGDGRVGCEARSIQFLRWNETIAESQPEGHICSQGCAVKALSKFMSPPVPPKPVPPKPMIQTGTTNGEDDHVRRLTLLAEESDASGMSATYQIEPEPRPLCTCGVRLDPNCPTHGPR